jgi:hypothetical protein
MCLFCGSADPLHGVGPVQLMLLGTGAVSAYASVIRPLRRRLARSSGDCAAEETGAPRSTAPRAASPAAVGES